MNGSNGRAVDVRLRHPGLYRMIMLSAAASLLLGLNFTLLQPTFLIWDQSNYLWGVVFFALGLSKLVFLNARRNLRLVRLSLYLSFVYVMTIALGTCQPFVDGEGSLQLPVLYGVWATLHWFLLAEASLNPWTASGDADK